MKTSWTCPTCGTEKGDCESGQGSVMVDVDRELTNQQRLEALFCHDCRWAFHPGLVTATWKLTPCAKHSRRLEENAA